MQSQLLAAPWKVTQVDSSEAYRWMEALPSNFIYKPLFTEGVCLEGFRTTLLDYLRTPAQVDGLQSVGIQDRIKCIKC